MFVFPLKNRSALYGACDNLNFKNTNSDAKNSCFLFYFKQENIGGDILKWGVVEHVLM